MGEAVSWDDYDYYDEYISGLHGLLQTLTRAARIDKKMMKEDFSRVFGEELGYWLIHINVKPDDYRLFILSRWILGETIKAYLRGRYTGKLVIPPQAKVLMMELAAKNRFDWLNLPRAISLEERIIRSLAEGVERGR